MRQYQETQMKQQARFFAKAVAVFVLGAAASLSLAQNFPTKPVKIIAPFAVGGGTDFMARMIAQHLGASMKQPFIVDNMPGANGALGSRVAAKAAADGYTLQLGSPGPNAVNGALYPKLPYSPQKDFVAVSMISMVPNVLVVNPSVPAKSVKELIELARAKPGSLNYGSTGAGSPAHLAAEMFSSAVNVKMVHVPYKGAGAALPDLLAGNIQVMFPDLLTALPHIRSGGLRALAVTTAQRSGSAPELQTMIEAGVPGYETGLWYGLFAPSGTPQDVLQQLNREVVKMLGQTDIRLKLTSQGAEPMQMSVVESNNFVKRETDRLGAVVRRLGLELE